MTVQELIRQLEAMPSGARVSGYDFDDWVEYPEIVFVTQESGQGVRISFTQDPN